MPQPKAFSSVAFFLCLTIFLLISFASSKPDGLSVELIHRDSPESPIYDAKLTNSERIRRLVLSSKIRAENLASDLTSNSSYSPEAFRHRVSYDGLNFMVKVLIGTPGVPLFLVPDSGSHLIWTQCEPCMRRFRQLPPIFNSTASHTFKELTCQAPFCRNNPDIFRCVDNKCIYRQRYGDGSETAGEAAQDILQSTNNDRIPFFFGCSKENRDFGAFEQAGKSGGIIGLSMSPVSMLEQLSHITQRRFSYCLNPVNYNPTATTLLRFGNDIPTRGRRFHSTPFVYLPSRPIYYLNLLDISVGSNRLHIPQGTFALRPDGTGGTIIDSGTSITLLTAQAYLPANNAFKAYFLHHGFRTIYVPGSHLDLCFTNGHNNYTFRDFPSMTFHFQGADFLVKPEYVYIKVNDRGVFCVALNAIAPHKHCVIGTVNQANTRFIYDAAHRQLLFGSEDCHRDNNM